MNNFTKPLNDPKRTAYSHKPARMTIDEIQQLGDVFKKLIDSTGLKFWIIAAGLGAILEGFHVIWLAARYIFRF